MLDIKFIRENPDIVKAAIKNRDLKLDIREVLDLDSERRKSLVEVEGLKAEKNTISKKGKPDKAIIDKMKGLSLKVDDLDKKVEEIDKKLGNLMLYIPNIPDNSIPIGGPENNKEIKKWGDCRKFNFKPKTHIEIDEDFDILDFPRSSKISGSGFFFFF